MAINVLKEEVKQATAGVINFVSSAATTSSTTVITTTTGGITTTSTTTVGITTTTSFAPIEGCCGDCYCSPFYIDGTVEIACGTRGKIGWYKGSGWPCNYFPASCQDADLNNWYGNCFYDVPDATYGCNPRRLCGYYYRPDEAPASYITFDGGCINTSLYWRLKHNYVSDTCQKKA